MDVRLYSLSTEEKTLDAISELKKQLLKNDIQITDDASLVISIGGDGTLLSAVHRFQDELEKLSFVGLHTGHLGFYSDWVVNEIKELVLNIKNKKPELTIYPMIEAEVFEPNKKNTVIHALNEISIRRLTNSLATDIKIDDVLFERFRGDGLVISTTAGSTAYNKSLGGSVIDPKIEAFQLSEIASINNIVYRTLGSSMVIAPTSCVTITPEIGVFEVAYDNYHFETKEVTKMILKLSDKKVKMADYKKVDFWNRVKNTFIGGELN
ncbi:MAG: NAD kinase [Lactobacillaceae bacterium]|jgi:NAD+ kinase|nr:NAD kinase [Lactobacillaceae bacterium]